MEFLIVLLVALLAAAIISGYVEYIKRKEVEEKADKVERLALKEKEMLVKAILTQGDKVFTAKTQMRTTWHAHQIIKKGKQVICLTAIVEASDGPGAVAAFEAQMKDVKAKMWIRSKAPVFAKPVFPNI